MKALNKQTRLWALGVILWGVWQTPGWAQDVLVLPVFGSQPETGLQFGAAGLWESSDAVDAVAVNLFAQGTEQQQYRATLGLQTPGWLTQRPDRLEFELLLRDFPDQFFGYQANFSSTGLSYTEQTWGLSARWWVPRDSTWEVGVGLRYLESSVRFVEPNNALLTDVAWRSGGSLWGVTAAVQRDTRDQPDWPRQGHRVLLEWSALNTDQQWPLIAAAEATGYQALNPGLILAGGLQVQAASASTPFLLMPELSGSQWLRGLRGGQYRHQSTVAGQTELRAELSPRWAAVGFTHLGQVGPNPASWFDNAWKVGYGGGLRFAVSSDRRLNLRLDYGVVDGREGIIFSFREAF